MRRPPREAPSGATHGAACAAPDGAHAASVRRLPTTDVVGYDCLAPGGALAQRLSGYETCNRDVLSTVYDLRPTTYVLRPTPYVLRPTPYDLRPTPYVLRPTSYAFHVARII